MDSFFSWNVMGMNCPIKQEDIKIFLQQQKVGMLGFLETKIKIQNLPQVMRNLCPQWNWTSNATSEDRGRVIVCLLYTSPSPRDGLLSRMPSSA